MSTTLTPPNSWQKVIDAHQQYSQAFNEFLSGTDKIDALRNALRGNERGLALRAVASLSVEEKKALFPEWIHLARAAHGPFQIAWNVIESLPRSWVLQHIPEEMDAILRGEEETDYWMFLQLCARLDSGLARRLALRAASHIDPEIRELGEQYLASSPADNK